MISRAAIKSGPESGTASEYRPNPKLITRLLLNSVDAILVDITRVLLIFDDCYRLLPSKTVAHSLHPSVSSPVADKMSLLQKETKFEQHRPVEAKALEATSLVLTTKSSVAGKLVLIGVPGTPPGAIIPRFDCTLRGVSFPTGQAGNDYLSTTDRTGRSVVRCNVRIELLPDTSLLLQGLKPCLDRLRLVANLLVNLMSRQVRIDVSGGTIQGFEGEGSSRVLVINCVGNRLVEIEGDRVCTLVLGKSHYLDQGLY